MSKRGDRIYSELLSMTVGLSQQELLEIQGILTTDLADSLDIQRSNVSMELNKMVRDGKVGKIKTFPVRYIPVEVIEKNFDFQWNTPPYEIKSLNELLSMDGTEMLFEKDPFQSLIGAEGSLKQPIAQAKAALLYPPHGLPTLFSGNHGNGKGAFARAMHQCDCAAHGEESPFLQFACNEYPTGEEQAELLFGTRDEKGLLQKAHTGVLYISEIHLLKAPAREILFGFLASGALPKEYTAGGFSQPEVLIIGGSSATPATLEPFMNNFTMNIKLPDFAERPLQEQIDLCLQFFFLESKRIQKELDIHIDVINALIESTTYGGLSELHSNIQMTCAHAFLYLDKEATTMVIKVEDLPRELGNKWASSRERIHSRKRVTPYLETHTIISPKKERIFLEETESFDVYQVIEEKMAFLRQEGIEESTINQYILTDLHVQLKNHYTQNKDRYGRLEKFVDPSIIELVEKFRPEIEKSLGVSFGQKFVYFVSMHLEAYRKRENTSAPLPQNEIEEIKREHPKEYASAMLLAERIHGEFSMILPETEIAYLAILFLSIEELEEKQQVGLLVLAHGESTATSMLDVATQLFGEGPVAALDMPLSSPLSSMMDQIEAKVNEVHCGNGVLLLVDMGSLESVEEHLKEKMGIAMRTLPNVTTAMVLEAVRKLSYPDYTLDTLYDSLYQDFFGAQRSVPKLAKKEKAIVCICMSGSGTAEKLRSIIQELIYQESNKPISIQTVSALKLKETLPKLAEDYQIIATVGTKNPHLEAPHISLEYLIDGDGEKDLISVIRGLPMLGKGSISGKKIVVSDLCVDTLKRHLVYFNPYIITDMLLDWCQQLEKQMKTSFSNTFLIRLVIHTAFAFERSLRKEPLSYAEPISPQMEAILPIVSETLAPYEEKLDVQISKSEQWYLVNMLEEL